MSGLRVAVLASGAGTNLQAMLDTVHGREGIELVAVAGDEPTAPALERAREAGVEVGVFEEHTFTDRAARDSAMADWLVEREVGLVVLAGYMRLLSESFLERFPSRIINVHPALLPAFAGLDAIQQAIELPDPVDADAVHDLLRPLEHELLPEAIRLIARGAVSFDEANPRRVVIRD